MHADLFSASCRASALKHLSLADNPIGELPQRGLCFSTGLKTLILSGTTIMNYTANIGRVHLPEKLIGLGLCNSTQSAEWAQIPWRLPSSLRCLNIYCSPEITAGLVHRPGTLTWSHDLTLDYGHTGLPPHVWIKNIRRDLAWRQYDLVNSTGNHAA